jgi:hypothetical protein
MNCSACGKNKKLVEFGKDKHAKNGRCSQCKACRSKYRTENKATIDSHRAAHREEATAYSKSYYKENKETVLAKSAIYYEENKEEKLAYQKTYGTEHKEEKQTYNTDYYQENKERLIAEQHVRYQENKEGIFAQQAVYRKANLEMFAAFAARRRAAKLQRTPLWFTKDDFKKIKSFYTLARKMTKETGIKHEVDHILPLCGEEISGFHHWNNLQVLTKKQNSAKGNKIMPSIVGFFPEGFGPCTMI